MGLNIKGLLMTCDMTSKYPTLLHNSGCLSLNKTKPLSVYPNISFTPGLSTVTVTHLDGQAKS
jgi:hypothetical protein